MNCPTCNVQNRDGAHFCDGCGSPLLINIVCRSCKSDNRAKAKFCDSCGAPFSRYKSTKQGSANFKIVWGGVCVLVVIGLGIKYGGPILNLHSPASELPVNVPVQPAITGAIPAQPVSSTADQEISLAVQSIRTKVLNSWVRPISATPGLKCRLKVKLLPSGDVTEVVIFASSGDLVFDRSAESAIRRASPLPVPANREIFNQRFKDLIYVFMPE